MNDVDRALIRALVSAISRAILDELARHPVEAVPPRERDPTYACLERRVVDLERATPKPKPAATGIAPKLYTVRDVCTLIGVTRQWIWKRERAGEFPKRFAITPGGRKRFHAAEVDAWIAAQSVPPTPEPTTPARFGTPYARRHARLMAANRARQKAKGEAGS